MAGNYTTGSTEKSLISRSAMPFMFFMQSDVKKQCPVAPLLTDLTKMHFTAVCMPQMCQLPNLNPECHILNLKLL